MSQSLSKTKRRISSVKNTKKITEAMGLVATVKLKKYKAVMEKNRAYVLEMENVIKNVLNSIEKEDSIYLSDAKGEKDLIILVNSNLGLCSSYNSSINNFLNKNINNKNSLILLIGRKGEINLKNNNFEFDISYIDLSNQLSYEKCRKLSNILLKDFKDNKYRSIKILYTKYVNSLKFVPTIKNILPIKKDNNGNTSSYSTLFDENVKTIIEELIPINIASIIYQALIESQVSEQASRRNAMDNANDNADEIIEKLTLEFNKARQASITQEISEVVSSQIN